MIMTYLLSHYRARGSSLLKNLPPWPQTDGLQVAEISDALGLVPVSIRKRVDRAIAHVVDQGLDRFMECCRADRRCDSY